MSDLMLEAALRRDRYIVLAALVAVTAMAWSYVLWLARGMDMSTAEMAAMMTTAFKPWSLADFGFMLGMWMVMMIGMMTPSAAPMILLYARVGRQAFIQGKPFAASGWFAAGYLLAWAGFSLLATLVQWMLERTALLTPMMESTNNSFGGIVLIAIGVYQWSPLKYACLDQCQAPLSFIQRHGGFRQEASASLQLGARHGAYCVGCCWALMALLFVGGIMNILWIAAITMMVLLEKIIPAGRIVPRIVGLALAVEGIRLLIATVN